MKSQVRIGEELTVEVKRIGINGEGIAYYKKQAIFIDGVLPTELIRIKIIKLERGFAQAKLLKIQRRSITRTKPFCKYFDECGGCQLQHIKYEEALKEKRNILINSFNRYTDLNIRKFEIRNTASSKKNKNYRNKSSLPVRYDGVKSVVGIYKPNSNRLVHIDSCPIQHEIINKVNTEILHIFDKFNTYAYNPKDNSGFIKYLVVRYSEYEKKTQVTLILNKKTSKLDSLSNEIMKLKEVKSVYYDINDIKESHEIFGNSLTHLKGEEEFIEKIGEFKFSLSPKTFFQLNTSQIENLYNKIKKIVKVNKDDKIVDCYSGAGTIGIWLSKYVSEVRGVDISKESIESANKNLSLNKVENALYEQGDAVKVINKWEKEDFKPSIFIVDPPRVGLGFKLINDIISLKPKRIVYISCNPSTLAKDIDMFSEYYNINLVEPLDMFPHTSHVESITLLEWKK